MGCGEVGRERVVIILGIKVPRGWGQIHMG